MVLVLATAGTVMTAAPVIGACADVRDLLDYSQECQDAAAIPFTFEEISVRTLQLILRCCVLRLLLATRCSAPLRPRNPDGCKLMDIANISGTTFGYLWKDLLIPFFKCLPFVQPAAQPSATPAPSTPATSSSLTQSLPTSAPATPAPANSAPAIPAAPAPVPASLTATPTFTLEPTLPKPAC